MSKLRSFVKRMPIVGNLARTIYATLRRDTRDQRGFPGSRAYWEDRYVAGGDSGIGSYCKFAEFKAEVLNAFVADNDIGTVVEFGCGDGNQLMLANYPRYTGFDVSPTAIAMCREKFQSDASKRFETMDAYSSQKAELALSLDVIYHLVEDDVFEHYMRRLFDAATRFVIIYSSDTDDNAGHETSHIRHRKFTRWVEENVTGWSLDDHIPNRYPYDGDYTQGSFADFFIYRKTG